MNHFFSILSKGILSSLLLLEQGCNIRSQEFPAPVLEAGETVFMGSPQEETADFLWEGGLAAHMADIRYLNENNLFSSDTPWDTEIMKYQGRWKNADLNIALVIDYHTATFSASGMWKDLDRQIAFVGMPPQFFIRNSFFSIESLYEYHGETYISISRKKDKMYRRIHLKRTNSRVP